MTRVRTYLIGVALTCLFAACDSKAGDKNAVEGDATSGGSAVGGTFGTTGGTEDVVTQTSGGANGAALGGTGSISGLIDAAVTLDEGGSGEAEIGDAGTEAAVTEVGSDAAADAASDAPITSDGEISTQSDAGPSTLPPLDDQTPPLWANGILIDEKGLLWIADGAGSQILRLNPPPEVKIVERYGEAEGVIRPDDLVIDEHYVYWTGAFDGIVGKLDRDSGQSTEIENLGVGVNPIAFGNDGMLLVGLSEGPTGLYEIDPAEQAAPRTISESVDSNAFTLAPDGFLYGSSYNDVIKVDLTTGEFETLVDGFVFCCSVRYNPLDGYLYALDILPSPVIYRVSLDGSSKELFATLSSQYSADNFAIAEDGTFLITRLLNPVITRVSADGLTVEDFSIGE